jgi:hypothetical protein
MPEGVRRSSVNEVAAYFYKKYGSQKTKERSVGLFRDTASGTVNRPRISRSAFERAIGQVLELGVVPDEFIRKLDLHIQHLNEKSVCSFKHNSNDTFKRLEAMLATADLFGCRLGMDLGSNYFKKLAEIMGVSTLVNDNYIVRTKEKIPVALRVAVWNRYCGTTARQSLCPFCNAEIKLETFHCAHDIAECNEGETNINNLYPCCSNCNLSMGSSRFAEWIKRWQKDARI